MTTAPLRTLIVDDELPARRVLAHLLRESQDVQLVGVASNGLQALEVLAREPIDLLFLDIEMPAFGGLQLATRLQPAISPAIVFVTAWPQYAVTAFEVGAVDYLLKPVDRERLATTIARARRRLSESEPDAIMQVRVAPSEASAEPDHVWVEHGTARLRLPLADIEWFAANGDYVMAHTADRSYLMRGSLNELETTLPPSRFLRVHRSTLVNLDAVVRVASVDGRLLLTTRAGATLKVGRRVQRRVRQTLAGTSRSG